MARALRNASIEPLTPARLRHPFTRIADSILGSRGCFFTFHRAVKSELWENLPNRGFHLDLDYLDRLLTYLRRNGWAIVTIEDALRRAAGGNRDGSYVNFSIDDGYRDTFENVVPLFRRHGCPVTVYVTTGIPDGTLALTQAGLEDVLSSREKVILHGELIEVRSTEAKRDVFARISALWEGPDQAQHYADFCRANDIDMEAMHWKHAISWEMLEAMRGDPCVEIGAHTVTHPHVSQLSPAEAFTELKSCRDRLIDKLAIDIRHFAFPFGRSGDCGPRDFALAREAGFASAATTRKGLLRAGQDPYSLPRNTLNGAHRHLFAAELHLTGATGLAAKVLGRD